MKYKLPKKLVLMPDGELCMEDGSDVKKYLSDYYAGLRHPGSFILINLITNRRAQELQDAAILIANWGS